MSTLMLFFGSAILFMFQASQAQSVVYSFRTFLKSINPNADLIILTPNPAPIKDDHSQGLGLAGRQFAIYSPEELSKALRIVDNWTKLTYLAEFRDVPSTISFITHFGLQIASLYPGWVTWRLVIFWPGDSLSENDQSTLLHSTVGNIFNITTSFKISSEFFIVFSNKKPVEHGVSAHEASTPFTFYEIYGIEGNLIIKQVGDLGNISPNCKWCPPWTGRRLDFYGTELSVGGIEDPESVNDTDYVRDPSTGDVRFSRGFSVEQFLMLQEALNFTYTAKIWNASMANDAGEPSAWDGVVAAAESGQIDLGVSVSVYIPARSERVSMLPPSDEYVVSAFFRPLNLNSVRDIFTQPFKIDLWMAVLTTWLVLAFSMILFSAIRYRVGAVANSGVDEPDFTQHSLIWAIATACQQGWDEHPVSISMRLIFISSSFTAFIAYAGYSAAIVSTLSTKVELIKSSDDLIYNGFTMGLRSGYLDVLLADNNKNDGTSRIIDYIRKFKKKAGMDTETATSRLIHSHTLFAFVCVRDAFYDILTEKLSDKDICKFRDMPVMETQIPVGSFTPKNSPYKQFFRVIEELNNNRLLRVRERGFLWRMKDAYLYHRRCLVSDDSKEAQALGFNDVFTALMILLGGNVCSTILLGVERVLYRKTLKYIE